MAIIKYTCPPQASGEGSFSDNLVGFQLVDGGGFTQANFEFTTNVTEKVNRTFSLGSFSDPISLQTLNIDDIEQSKLLVNKNFQVYPNYDLSEITNFTIYGSLAKRFSVSLTKIINYFPAGLEVIPYTLRLTTGQTVSSYSYNIIENETYFEIPLNLIRNPFDIDFTENATRNLQLREITVSNLRNLTVEYPKYAAYIDDVEYPINSIIPLTNTDTTFKLYIEGNPFSGATEIFSKILIRPTDFYVNKVFNEEFDQVENFLLNRQVSPIYTSYFSTPIENEDGSYTIVPEVVRFPINGLWNLDITGNEFNDYLLKLNKIAENLDTYRTNLLSRFLTTGAIKEFDTQDQKVEKILQVYGRSFDETKKFIGALAFMNSVNYTVKNDIPSQLLKNLAQTLGWKDNISPITNEQLLNSVFSTGENTFTGVSKGQTPEELNYQYYRNLILNSAYLFKSKGTRKSIEILLRLIGAPEAITEFNEYVYVADRRVNLNQFGEEYAKLSGGTYVQDLPVLDTTDIFSIQGVQYTGFTTTTIVQDITVTRSSYPIDSFGYPSMPIENENYFFQIGGGWIESTPQHRMPEQVDITTSVFTGSNPNYQTVLLPFNYGDEYLQRYKQFPYMELGYKIRKTVDNKKSWISDENIIRRSSDGNFNAYYPVSDDRLVINVKNVDIFMNPSQGLVYDVWVMSRRYNYPIPEQGLNYITPTYCNPNPNTPYPQRGGIDWTEIIPKPKQKTFFEFAQSFWHNTINVRNRQYITDGKTGGYPTLQSIYWKYLESRALAGLENDNFTYQTMIDYVNGIGDYWIRLIEQMVPATTIWNAGTKYENSIFHRQKYVWRRQMGCQIVLVPCNPCSLVGQIFAYDCPIQTVTCSVFPWDQNPFVTSFGSLLGYSLNQYLNANGLTFDSCDMNSLQTSWFVNVVYNGNTIINYPFFNGVGYNNPLSVPTGQTWINAITNSFVDLQNYGLTYYFNDSYTNITIYNNSCIPINITQTFDLNVGINFNLLCN
jgi:hypothetical protein